MNGFCKNQHLITVFGPEKIRQTVISRPLRGRCLDKIRHAKGFWKTVSRKYKREVVGSH